MTDAILGLIFILILLSVYINMPGARRYTKRSSHNVEDFQYSIYDDVPNEEDENQSTNPLISEMLEDILGIYQSNVEGKRERLATALTEVSFHIDTSDFLEEHPYICRYIFNIP